MSYDVGELIAAAREGDRQARDLLVRLVQPILTLYVSAKMGSKLRRVMEVEDVTQPVLVEFVGRLDSLGPGAAKRELVRLLLWLAKRRIIDFGRRYERWAGESACEHAFGDVADGRQRSGTVTTADILERIGRLVPEHYAVVVDAVGRRGLTFAEAAGELGLSADAVRKRYHRVIALCVEQLK